MKKGETIITFGGWYQRTTLHLTEIHDFLVHAVSKLDLDSEKLLNYHKKLNLKSVSREIGYLEHVKAITKDGIEIRYYEDGLYVLEMKSSDELKSSKILKKYFEECFNPAINYIFSLGAPTPKILSNISDNHLFVISKIELNHSSFKIDKKIFGEVYSKVSYHEISVYKTSNYIFIIASPSQENNLRLLTEMQIFFREFKGQLRKYLNIHRKIWEEIAKIKENKEIHGKKVVEYKTKLEAYKVTIDLINRRINQMSTYAHTRASISKELSIEKNLTVLFQYRFEDLFNTLSYIKEIWAMTIDYVSSAISVFKDLDNKLTMSGIRSIQLLASIGVVTGIVGYLAKDSLPAITYIGFGYLIVLSVTAFIIDYLIRLYSKNKKYKLKFIEREKNI
jgi:hypothetical protein